MNRKHTFYFSITSGMIFCLTLLLVGGCSNNNYEKKQLDNGELYFNNSVPQDKIESLGNYINQCAVFTNDVNKARIIKTDSTYEISLSVPPAKINSDSYQVYIEILATQLSEDIFNHSAVKIHLTDADFNTKVTKSSQQNSE